MSGRTYLKVKIKSCAHEAKVIRKEEFRFKFKRVKALDPHGVVVTFYNRVKVKSKHIHIVDALHAHRTGILRADARNTQIAYAFIRGRKASAVLPKNKHKIDRNQVRRMVLAYGSSGDLYNLPSNHPAVVAEVTRLEAWLDSNEEPP